MYVFVVRVHIRILLYNVTILIKSYENAYILMGKGTQN